MVPPRKDDDLGRSEGYDQFPDEGASEGFCESDDSGSGSAPPPRISAAREDVFRRLRDVLSGESDEREAAVLPWLQALDLQVLGACRADERSKPLLKLNVSGSPAEERLLAQLSQHFEASEVGMLARCLCVPLVSVRVGKVKKQGSILCPTAKRRRFLSLYRGQLNLNLLPSSNMRLSFIGDDGCTERLAVLTNDFDSPDVVIEEISADTSGRSFLLKLPGPQILYYWCSEKSKIHGLELLDKMKDLLRKKPSLSCLTGISESRLDSFATHLRAYLLGGSSSAEVSPAASCPTETECQSSRSFRSRTMSAHAGKVHSLCQGSLSPRLNSFKDEMPRMLSSIRTREKIKYHGDAHLSMSTRSSELITSISPSSSNVAYSSKRENDNPSNTGGSSTLPSCLPDIPSLPSPFSTLNPVSIHLPLTQISSSSSFSPYYCWCPPCPSSLQYTVNPFHLSSTPSELIPLPPLSSLLPVASSTVASVPSRLPIDVAECQALSLPSLIPDPLIPSSISVTLSLPCSQQLPIFTPFMTDPIVHIPMFNFCSSGQGYLVSAGPAISSVISPLLPTLVTPLIPKTESLIEKNARETLHMLMASAPSVTGPQLINVLPAVLNKLGENFSCTNMVNNSSALAGNSQLFCDGSTDTVSTGSSCLNLHSEEGTPRADDSLRFTMADHLDNDDNIDEPLWDDDLL